MFSRYINLKQIDFPFRIPLWVILIIPSTLIMTTVVTLTGYLSYKNNQVIVNDIATQLLSEISARTTSHLSAFLRIPSHINQSNANVIQNQLLDTTDIEAVRHYLWEEIQIYDTVSSIYFGNTQGGLISAGREGADGSLYLITTENFAAGKLDKVAVDTAGHPTTVLVSVPNFDARIRPWYVGATEGGEAFWTAPYVLSTGQDLALAASLPVYDSQHERLGVVSVDIFISHVSDFLEELDIGEHGQAYIVEQSGLLVATSTDSAPSIREGESGWQRLAASDSSDRLIATSTSYIATELDGFSNIVNQQQHLMTMAGKRYFLSVTPYDMGNGLDWYVVILIPEDDFLAQITARNRLILVLTLSAVVISIVIGVLTAIQVSSPIARLSAAATNIANGKWSDSVPIAGTQEIQQLGQSFNAMTAQLREAFTHLEERVHIRTAELEASEARYRAIVEDQTELLCRFVADYTLTFVNDAYCRYFEVSSSELLGKSLTPRIHEDDQHVVNQMETLTRENPTISIEHRVIKRDGQIRWMHWVNRALFDEAGQVIEYQAVGRDITERKQLEETMQTALAHETELSELKSQFIATVSHEFRTPMAIILSSMQMLERYGDKLDKTRHAEHFRRIQTQIQHMTGLLDDAITINRIERGNAAFNPDVLDIVNLCQNVIDEVRLITETSITFGVIGDCSETRGDRRLLHLIFTNLISNAAKYSSGMPVKVELVCSKTQILFVVKDEGIGIPPDAQTRIFEPFYRANNVDAVNGIGLGLAIVKHSVELHGGTLLFESEVGKGTTFTVTFPKHFA
jgi:PAS domain S-box-containing protein